MKSFILITKYSSFPEIIVSFSLLEHPGHKLCGTYLLLIFLTKTLFKIYYQTKIYQEL
jgi:hypothetical protein